MSAVMPPLDDDFVPPPLDREVAQLRVCRRIRWRPESRLGGLLLDNNAWDRGDSLREGDFYRHEHHADLRGHRCADQCQQAGST